MGFCICMKCQERSLDKTTTKNPKKNQNKQTKKAPTKSKPTTQQERRDEDTALFGMGFSWLLGTSWSFLHLKLAFCQHNVGYTEWAKWLKFLFPWQGKSQKLCTASEVSYQGASLSQMGFFDSICCIHPVIPLVRIVHYLPIAFNFLTAKLPSQLFNLPEYKLIHIQVLRLLPQIKKSSSLQQKVV